MYEHSHLKKKKSAHHGREFLISGASSRVMLVSNVFPMTEALLSKYCVQNPVMYIPDNFGEKPAVVLYPYINRHTGTPKKL